MDSCFGLAGPHQHGVANIPGGWNGCAHAWCVGHTRLVLACVTLLLFLNKIDHFHKWRPPLHSFVFILIRPTTLILKQIFSVLNLLIAARLERLIRIKTKEHFIWPPLWKRSTCHIKWSYDPRSYERTLWAIGLLQQTITWYKIHHGGGQAHYYSPTGTLKQSDLNQLSLTCLCFNVPVG